MGILQRPPTWLIHGVLFLVQGVGVGAGTVIGKIGLADVDPIVFALYRDALAAPLLLLWSLRAEGSGMRVERADWPGVVVGALFLFLSNLCYTVGVKISNAVIGAAWQTAVPIVTAGAAICIGWEKATPLKLGGMMLAFGGSIFILFFYPEAVGSSSHHHGNRSGTGSR